MRVSLSLRPHRGGNYYRARYYDPGLQRFVSEDPIGFRGGSINLYGYVQGNPVGYSDPLGLAVGDYPPPPPGYDPRTWTTGRFGNEGRWFLTDPEGSRWIAHPEDRRHWRHWDKKDKGGGDRGRWPGDSIKPRPGQKRLTKEHCAEDPSGDAAPWRPGDLDYIIVEGTGAPIAGWLWLEMPLGSPVRVPIMFAPRIPVFP
jgi:RHS repeat-associated protein